MYAIRTCVFASEAVSGERQTTVAECTLVSSKYFITIFIFLYIVYQVFLFCFSIASKE